MSNSSCSDFWDALAPHHGAIENSFFDLPSIRRLLGVIRQPVLVVGAGHGLIVAELQNRGFRCDGVDLSPEMIKYAKQRRGLTLVEANARAMPFEPGTYGTVIYATGVIDFMSDEEEIGVILKEGKRIVQASGNIFVAFYKVSRVSESFMETVGLLKDNVMCQRQSLEMYLLNPVQMVAWVAKRADRGYWRATALMLRLSALTTFQEKAMTFRMQKIFRNQATARALLDAAPEKQPYRNAAEIRNLFQRLAIPIKQVQTFSSCYIVQI